MGGPVTASTALEARVSASIDAACQKGEHQMRIQLDTKQGNEHRPSFAQSKAARPDSALHKARTRAREKVPAAGPYASEQPCRCTVLLSAKSRHSLPEMSRMYKSSF